VSPGAGRILTSASDYWSSFLGDCTAIAQKPHVGALLGRARHIVITLDRPALAGVLRTAGLIEQASGSGEINRIAEQLHLAMQVDGLDLGDVTE
jgi:hypothetical protein